MQYYRFVRFWQGEFEKIQDNVQNWDGMTRHRLALAPKRAATMSPALQRGR